VILAGRKTLAALAFLLLALAGAPSAHGGADGARTRVVRVICRVFGPYCQEAIAVAWCESRFDVWARNGEHFGLFQMGRRERSLYGDGLGPWNQSRAAFRYFRASGYTWRPWVCRP
jgi:hypothetical protein